MFFSHSFTKLYTVSFILATLFTESVCLNLVQQFGQLVSQEIRSSIPPGFTAVAVARPDQILNLRIALTQNNISGLEAVLYDVSTPGSPSYGKYLTKEQVDAYVAPSDNSTSLVHSWLSQNNLTATNVTSTGNWLEISLPVSIANSLLAANFTIFKHDETGIQFTRTLAYSIPAALKNHIQLIHPTTSFAIVNHLSPTIQAAKVTKSLQKIMKPRQTSNDSACDTTVTPQCIQSLYNLPSGPSGSSSIGNTVGVSGFSNQFANQADLAVFLQSFRSDLDPSINFTSQFVDDGSNSQVQADAGVEASLDIQYTVGLVSTIPVSFISVGEDNNDDGLDGFLDLTNFLSDQDDSSLPSILTTSYGFDEATISPDLANQLCTAYVQLGVRGTSILFASGDGGVSGSQASADCTNFVPTFPSGCPYITSVGGTTGNPTETAAAFSSGGFSNVFPRPPYQDTAVTNYLNVLGGANAGLFNASGRAFPDVSAQGSGLQIVVDNVVQPVDGTSCSSPIFASVIALLNDLLIANGEPRLGFLNPLLYGEGSTSAFRDITSGTNPGCGTDGFPAVAGWDPVTGLGTPNFTGMKAILGII